VEGTPGLDFCVLSGSNVIVDFFPLTSFDLMFPCRALKLLKACLNGNKETARNRNCS
jgi:hypothetical protein